MAGLEPAISLGGTQVPMQTDGRVKAGHDEKAADESPSMSFGITLNPADGDSLRD
jgi:hypothetical protein